MSIQHPAFVLALLMGAAVPAGAAMTAPALVAPTSSSTAIKSPTQGDLGDSAYTFGPKGAKFGRPGQFFLYGYTAANTGLTITSATNFSLELNPGLGYFLNDIFFVALGVDLGFFTAGSTSIFGISPAFGGQLAMGDMVTLLLQGGLTVAYTNLGSFSVPGGGTVAGSSSTAVSINLAAPFLFHLLPHFSASVAPAIDIGLSGAVKTTFIGVKVGVLGWT